MTPPRRTIPLLTTALLFCSCEQPFDPRGTQDRQLVVFSILSTDRSQQYVRVERDYMPEGFDPLAYTADKSIAGATVLLSTGNLTYQLRDTVLPRDDTSRTSLPLRCYVMSSFTPEYGRAYEVRASAHQYEPVAGAATVPSRPSVGLDPLSSYVLDNPSQNPPEAGIIFPLTLGATTKGFIARLFIDYDVVKNGQWIAERVEVPVSYAYSGTKDVRWVLYGRLTARPPTGRTSGTYMNDLYSKTLATISDTYKSDRMIFNKVVFQLLQMERNLYNYYYVAHAYNDPHSLRLDEPLYSNVHGGSGIVGAYTLDSLVHVLPEHFSFNR